MNYSKRDIEAPLLAWKLSSTRKPLLIRGARQVGKTTTIRKIGQLFSHFIEVNFEQRPDIATVFNKNLDVARICEELSILYNKPIVEDETLLFFDEIQVSEQAIASLRYFFEQKPRLHVIAASSLLEFALSELPSFGVGRIDSLFMYPMSFAEFLTACNADMLRQAIEKASPEEPLSENLHQKALDFFKRFLILGGMPKVVQLYVETQDILLCQKEIDGLINSIEDDFAKYKHRFSVSIIKETFRSVVAQNGGKFVISKVAQELNSWQVKVALELLTMAGIILPVVQSHGNGVPLRAEINLKNKKYLIFDTGIFQRMNMLDMSELFLSDDFEVINKGVIAELFVGLEIIKSLDYYRRQELYYWHREARNSNAEVDYLIQKEGKIIPVEVKSGKKGSMQSLYLFLESKNIPWGVRVSQENFGIHDKVRIFPLYAIQNLI